MENFIYSLIEQINGYPQWCVYLFTYISGWIQVAFPPYPGEVILVINGCIQSEKPLLQSLFLFFVYWLSIISANFVLYELGYRKGEALLKHRIFSGLLSLKNNEKIKRLIKKYGFFIYLAAIYVPGLYLPLVFYSGIMKFKRHAVLTGIMLATLVHDIILFLGGRFVGNNLRSIASFITMYKNIVLCVAAVIVIFFIYVLFLSKRRDSDTETV